MGGNESRKYKIRIVNLSAGAGENLEPGRKNVDRSCRASLGLGVWLLCGVIREVTGPEKGTIAIPGNSRKVITVIAAKNRKKAEKGSCSGEPVYEKNVE